MTTFHTSSVQSGSTGRYFYEVYKDDPASDTTAEVQFSVAYGHFDGSGSYGQTNNFPSKAIYRQFRNILLTPGDNRFTFAGTGDNTNPKDAYFISMQRARLREKMDPGNWELRISGSGKTTVKLIDDSGATTNPSVNVGGRVFNVVSGSIATGTAVTKTTAAAQQGGAYGLFYPDLGIIVLNGPTTSVSASINRASGSAGTTDPSNALDLVEGIKRGAYFVSRREENLNTTHYFCRATNQKFNYTNNPTFFTASDGTLTVSSFDSDPHTYITTVGLYNDNNELLAVAKLSTPIQKSFSREAIVKVKLDY